MIGASRTPFATRGGAVALARHSQLGPYVYPPSRRILELARRADRVAETCALFDQSHHMAECDRRPGRDKLLSATRHQQLRELRVNKAKQFVALQPRRLRDRRCDPVLPRRGHSRSSAGRPTTTGCSSTRRRASTTSSVERDERRRPPDGRRRRLYRYPGAGTERARGAATSERRPAPRNPVLQHGRHHDRRPQGSRAPPRHGRRARDGALRSVGGRDEVSAAIVEAGASSACSRSARASTPPTRSSRGGFPARFPPCSRATS